ncbi:hypothetical protein WJX84_002164 [Apatococcus fuscideae]|uniref:Uncharacterized protein n=1 Tax=Apatococcus fuscideae TaxID=2026836 RepID=A0AAW1T9G7_9CHLO
MVEEFGKQVHMDTPMAIANLTSSRAPFYKRVYGIYADSIAQGKDLLSGLILWAYTPHVDRELFRECRNCFAIQVTPTDYVFQDIVQPIAEAAQAAMRAAEPVKGCTPVPAKLGTRLSPHQPGLGSSKFTLSSLMSALSSAGSRTALQSGGEPALLASGKAAGSRCRGRKDQGRSEARQLHPKHHHSQLVASPASPRRHLQEA